MTRTEAIAEIQSRLGGLSGDRIEALADVVRTWSQPTVFSGLSAADRVALDAAVDSLDRGEGIDLDVFDASLECKLRAAGA